MASCFVGFGLVSSDKHSYCLHHLQAVTAISLSHYTLVLTVKNKIVVVLQAPGEQRTKSWYFVDFSPKDLFVRINHLLVPSPSHATRTMLLLKVVTGEWT